MEISKIILKKLKFPILIIKQAKITQSEKNLQTYEKDLAYRIKKLPELMQEAEEADAGISDFPPQKKRTTRVKRNAYI
jgi:hypothetical protein